VKLLEFFEGMYGTGAWEGAGENGSANGGGGGEEKGKGREKGEVVFSTESAEKESRALREAPDVLERGLLGKFVEVWARKWDLEDKE